MSDKCPIVKQELDKIKKSYDYFSEGETITMWDLEIPFNSGLNDTYILEEPKPQSCEHEPVDVGFIQPKMVCKKCDKDL